ncbi:MAG TPA: hypothetical protein VGP95_09810 [Gemmatimonadaceae bacterium]|jgi:hypothetical protein|nr:hypothetical protein [Gemmatimonadaceae bacterium]
MSHLRSVTTAIAVLLIAAPLTAQTSPTSPDTTVLVAPAGSSSVVPSAVVIDRVPSAGPTPSWTNATSTARVEAPQPAAVRRIESGSTPENKAMMIVGGAGVLVGAIVGGRAGTAIMVGGGVVGLVGLWNYLK